MIEEGSMQCSNPTYDPSGFNTREISVSNEPGLPTEHITLAATTTSTTPVLTGKLRPDPTTLGEVAL
jgi:hypothetical protein